MGKFQSFEELVSYIKEHADIIDVISDYVELKRVGAQWMGKCPFHPDKNPSFSVSGEKGLYHCFGCGASGDVIKFIEDIEGVSFIEALEILGEKVGIDVESELRELRGKKDNIPTSPAKTLKKAVAYAAEYYHRILISESASKVVLQYLYERGLENTDIVEWKLGFASPTKPFYQFIKEKRLSMKPFIEAGILKKDGTDTMRNRIIIPIADGTGKFVSLGGRLWKGEGPKYLNGPETPIFKKGNILFGMHRARKSGKEKGRMIFVEGYFDVILMHKYGFTETVAPLGTAVSDRASREIASLVKKAYLIFDPDAAGVKATISTGFKLSSLGTAVYVVNLPGGMDPDEYVVQYGEDGMERMLMGGIPFAEYVSTLIIGNIEIHDTGKVIKLMRNLENFSAFATDGNREIWNTIATFIEKQLSIPAPEIVSRLYRMKGGQRISSHKVNVSGPYDILEKGIYELLLIEPINYIYLPSEFVEDFKPHMDKLARLLGLITEFYENHPEDEPLEKFHIFIRSRDEEIARDIYTGRDIPTQDISKRFICLVSRWLMLKYRDLLQQSRNNPETFQELMERKKIAETIYTHKDLGCSRM